MQKTEQELKIIQDNCIETIQQDEWDYVIRFDSNMPLSFYQCRPLMVKYFDMMRRFRSHFFWIAQPKANQEGYEIYALLSVPLMVNKITMLGYTYYENVWEEVTYKLKHQENIRRIVNDEQSGEIKFTMNIKRLKPDECVAHSITENAGKPSVEFDYFK